MATGGFSTLNSSLGGFESKSIEYTVIIFMMLAGTNFTLLYFTLLLRKPGKLLGDLEWRTYAGIIIGSTVMVMIAGIYLTTDFNQQGDLTRQQEFETAFRDGLFQVVATITTTGFGTCEFSTSGHNFSRALLIVLMFVGGCAGSTGGGMKVIRHILFFKILGREIEHSYHPSVVRHIRLWWRSDYRSRFALATSWSTLASSH